MALPAALSIVSGVFKFVGGFVMKFAGPIFMYFQGKKSERLEHTEETLNEIEKQHEKHKTIEDAVRRMPDSTVYDELQSKYSKKRKR